jgi:aldehyde dehydrogenase (NAD+)
VRPRLSVISATLVGSVSVALKSEYYGIDRRVVPVPLAGEDAQHIVIEGIMTTPTSASPTFAPSRSDPAIDAARRIFDLQRGARWQIAQTTAAERRRKLRSLADAIKRHRAAIAQAIKEDFGKHPTETEITEIQLALTEVKEAISNLGRWMRPRRVRTPMHMIGTTSEIRYEPKGVVLIMSAWNYPFALLIAPLVAAIAAGNCAMLRPSEKVPATNRVVARIVGEVFDEREVALIEGDADVAETLLSFPFDHIFFTGSTRVGRIIMAAAAKTLASVTLELGGKSPAIVDETADIVAAAERIAWGKFISAGQACVAPDYVVVHRSVLTAFLDAAKRAVGGFYGPTEEARAKSPDISRVIDAKSAARLGSLIEDAVRRGATVECGGRWDAETRYVAPTILAGVAPDAEVMSEEIFGPVLPVLSYEKIDEVYRLIRSRGKPLAMYVFSRRNDNVESLLRNTSAGGTLVNHTLLHLANPHLPFGGVGESGFGAYHGEYGFRAFSHERSVVHQRWFSLTQMLYPPYGPRTERLVRWLDVFRS